MEDGMSRVIRQALVWLAFTVLMVVAVRAQKVSVNSDANYNFSEHKRYAWRDNRLQTRQNPDTNKVMDLKIVNSVNRLLASKGFTEVKENPDFYVHYDAGGNSNIGVGGADAINMSSGAPNDPTPTYGMGQGPMLTPSTWLITKGQIEFHMVDAKSKKAVWESTYQKTFRDPDKAMRNMDKEIDELVAKSFKEFPPKNKK